jgi:hypothetical protein
MCEPIDVELRGNPKFHVNWLIKYVFAVPADLCGSLHMLWASSKIVLRDRTLFEVTLQVVCRFPAFLKGFRGINQTWRGRLMLFCVIEHCSKSRFKKHAVLRHSLKAFEISTKLGEAVLMFAQIILKSF